MVDPKALKILFDTYWSSSGWKPNPETAPEDLADAVAAGVMFEAVSLDHDETVKWARKQCNRVDKDRVAAAFLASLSTRRLDLRSALGSYAVARHLPIHKALIRSASFGSCLVCEAWSNTTKHDLNVLNFERFKWGGVRHLDPVYMAFDLERFLETEPVDPTVADLEVIFNILEAARKLPAKGKVTDLERTTAKILKSNRHERQVLLQILGYCGILQPSGKPSFFDGFVSAGDREEPPWTTDLNYPLSCWRGSDGVCEPAVAFWFPELAL